MAEGSDPEAVGVRYPCSSPIRSGVPVPLLNRAIRIACSFALALSLMFVGAPPASAQPQSIVVAFSPVPYSLPSGADTDVPLSYNLPQGATWVSLALRLNDSKGKTIVYQSTWIGPQDPSARIDSVPSTTETSRMPLRFAEVTRQ